MLSRSHSNVLLTLVVLGMLSISMISASLIVKPTAAAGESWLPGWQYRKSHIINQATEAGTNYQVEVKVSYSTASPTWFTRLPTNIPVIMTNDVASNGTIFAGDSNYRIYKSIDSGLTFTNIYTIPMQPNAWGLMAGRVWTTFVDSRNYVYVSAGSTNRLYRSTDHGTSFIEVLNMPNRTTYADADIISMTEDASGSLYAAEYADTPPPGGARLWKSIDNGATWSSVSKTWSARHLHAVKYNPSNGWLYVVVGENSDGSQTEYQTVWRSKDGGNIWACVVAWGSDIYATKYLSIEFMGSDVYLGQDHQGGSETDLIQKITDDGAGPYTPVTAYYNPYPAALMTSATKLGNTMIFSTCSESVDPATCQVVMSDDGIHWTVLNAQAVSLAYKYINRLTVHPRTGFVYGCINYNYAYFIAPPSTPRPPSLQPPLDTVFAEGHCRTDFGDIRFTDDDGVTPLDYWMETKTDGDNAIFWVKVSDDLGSARTIYVYYGKGDATTTSNPVNTFLFYDDFSGGLSKWKSISGTWSIESENLVITPPTPGSTDNNYIVTATDIGTNKIAIKTRMKCEQVGSTAQAHPGLIFHANALTPVSSHQNDQVYFRPHQPSTNIVPAWFDGSVHLLTTKEGSYFTWNTWATVEVRIPSSGNVRLYGNDAYWHDWASHYTSSSNSRVGLMAHGYGKDYYDYFSVRKYVAPEPTHGTTGSEEMPQVPPSISNPSPTNGVTGVSISLSKLSFNLTDINNDLMNYEVTTNPPIGYQSRTGVTNGRYEVPISGLQRNTDYTWRVRATDPSGSNSLTDVTFSFRTIGFVGQSWLPGWQYRTSHVITSAAGAGTNYQTRVKVSYSTSTPTWFTVLPTNIPVFMTTDVSSDGTVFAGDNNYKIYKSTDSGVTFTNIFTIPAQSNPWGVHAGKVWTVFVDSRNYLFVSAGSTNRLYRSTDGGASFTEALNLNRGANDGMIISMTEDDNGNLYAAEYANVPPARLWKSTDGGVTWTSMRSWDARHLHAVKYNPTNKWVYVVVGENSDGSQTEYQTVWRSKDRGSTWTLIVARGPGTDTKYLPIEFIGNDVYLGQDRNGVTDTDDIHKITDDGGDIPFTPVLAYDNPYVAAIMTAATKVGDTIIFTTSSETTTATCQVVMSNDGNTWTVLNAQSVSTAIIWMNELTIHPRKCIVYGCINSNYCYYIASPSTPRPPSFQPPAFPETVVVDGHCKPDFGDIRFTDDDGTTPLDYWIETKVDGEYAIFWVEVADDLSSADGTIYVYYGKNDATTTSNPENTFLFFDDFSGSLSKWTQVSGTDTWTTESGNLVIQPTTINNYLITTNSIGTGNIAIRTKIESTQVLPTPYQAHPGVIWHANTLTGTSHRNDQVYFRPHDTLPSSTMGNIQPGYYIGTGGSFNTGIVFHSYKAGSYFNWNTWYTVEVRIPASGNVKLYGNDLYWHDWGNQQYSNDHIGLAAQDQGKDYFDYVAVRKYVDPEPAHSTWGSEETLTINSCNSAGTKKDTFDPGAEIWVNGSRGYSPSTTYNIYVVVDTDWTHITAFPATVSGTELTVTSNPDGSMLAKVWTSAKPGKYDIVIDINRNGIYDPGIDPIDDNQVVGTAGFFVIPEYVLGTILALGVCFAGVAVYKRSKRHRLKPF